MKSRIFGPLITQISHLPAAGRNYLDFDVVVGVQPFSVIRAAGVRKLGTGLWHIE
ncbi:hypothetical protein [Cecembia sp.]|uniref:hypothetical protein n=1 Tax=Cecembia sp. TaxID=1898110 RepID=UPI0025C0E4B6|nr:hypothetical protein [Cecembia sp.]